MTSYTLLAAVDRTIPSSNPKLRQRRLVLEQQLRSPREPGWGKHALEESPNPEGPDALRCRQQPAMTLSHGPLLYEGKAKRVYATDQDDQRVLVEYKNDATAFNALKKEPRSPIRVGLNCQISARLFEAA